MITKFNCTCGNNDPKKAIEYNGLAGYTALICTECASFSDNFGVNEADDWSKMTVKNNKK